MRVSLKHISSGGVMIIAAVREFLKDPRVKGIDIDSPEILDAHRKVIADKPLMKKVFERFYDELITGRDNYFSGNGAEIEIGAGVSFFKEKNNAVVTTDIKATPGLDGVLNAQNMNLASDSVKVIYGINCFHHFPSPRMFFSELDRVLNAGGGCMLIEPYHGPFAKQLYANVHKDEHFNPDQESWEHQSKMSFMSGANQALAYIIFVRDKEVFEKEFPGLEIVSTSRINNYLQYLLSGGVNFRQLVPNFMIPLVQMCEYLLTPISHLLALHYMIVIRKK